MKIYVTDQFKNGCFCKDVQPQMYQNTLQLKPFWRSKPVCVDTCLASEIGWLWQHGIETNGCCCGHGYDSDAYIGVYAASVEKMKELGYKQFVHPTHPPVRPKQTFIPKTIQLKPPLPF